MILDADQVARFEEEGYLFLPDVFTAEEVAVMRGEVPRIFAQRQIIEASPTGAIRRDHLQPIALLRETLHRAVGEPDAGHAGGGLQ